MHQKGRPAAAGGTCAHRAHHLHVCIPLFSHFHNLEFIKREKLNKLFISNANLNTSIVI